MVVLLEERPHGGDVVGVAADVDDESVGLGDRLRELAPAELVVHIVRQRARWDDRPEDAIDAAIEIVDR